MAWLHAAQSRRVDGPACARDSAAHVSEDVEGMARASCLRTCASAPCCLNSTGACACSASMCAYAGASMRGAHCRINKNTPMRPMLFTVPPLTNARNTHTHPQHTHPRTTPLLPRTHAPTQAHRWVDCGPQPPHRLDAFWGNPAVPAPAACARARPRTLPHTLRAHTHTRSAPRETAHTCTTHSVAHVIGHVQVANGDDPVMVSADHFKAKAAPCPRTPGAPAYTRARSKHTRRMRARVRTHEHVCRMSSLGRGYSPRDVPP